MKDFYLPALSRSVAYDRAVGFFSAGMLSYAAQGLSGLVRRDGRMRLIIGGELEADEVEAIRQGYDLRSIQERLDMRLVKSLQDVDDGIFQRRMELLSYLVAGGFLDIKLALKPRGMYHEKIGIFYDQDGRQLAFQGSANETVYALNPDFNFESVHVYPSWNPSAEPWFRPVLDGFDRLWSNRTKNAWVLDFPEALKEQLVKIAKQAKTIITPEVEQDLVARLGAIEKPTDVQEALQPGIPLSFKGNTYALRPHQKLALESWRAHDFRGIMNLATGAGKTITAIHGACSLLKACKSMALVIAVPYINLADQWVEALREFNITPIKCYEGVDLWKGRLSEAIDRFPSALPFLPIVVVNATLRSEVFQEQLKRIPADRMLWIGDECHHHASAELARSIPPARYILGLSATPFDAYDEGKRDRLSQTYGDVVADYPLQQALAEGVLTPYHYRVHPVALTQEEAVEYLQLSVEIGQRMGQGHGDGDESDEYLKRLLIKRARLLGGATNKVEVLANLIGNQAPEPFSLFYCSENLSDPDGADPQMQRVLELLTQRGWKASRFTSRETRRDRQDILETFRTGKVDAMVAIRCLDEGIDVPACRTAYILASSRNPRQFIQRRGRILRPATGKDSALIHDFFVTIPDNIVGSSTYERKLYARELERVAEFAKLSIDPIETIHVLREYLIKFDLGHIVI